MSRYNLIEEGWIPVRYPDGRREELGIGQLLREANRIAAIEDGSPLVVAALHRFLLAVLYRALEGPVSKEQAREWFRNGWPLEKIATYLQRWHDRFWLFDDQYPFGQIPGFHPERQRAWTALAAEHNADNAKVLFDHIAIATPGVISEGEACRWLLATLTFSVSSGKSELSHTGTAPSATGVIVLPIGRTLADTLNFSLVPQFAPVLAEDKPLWEREPESVGVLKAGPQRKISGLADRYTWRTRAILLDDTGGAVMRLAFASGVKHDSPDQIDPQVPYRVDEKLGTLPIPFRERGLWRDFDSLLPDQGGLAPAVISHALDLTRTLPDRRPRTIFSLGQSNDKAKIEFWRMERYELPQALTADRFIREDIHGYLEQAEASQKALYAACRTYARHIISRGEREVRSGDLEAFIRQLPTIPHYWSRLESAFHEVLHVYTAEADPEQIRREWLKTVCATLQESWNTLAVMVTTGDAWALRALALAEGQIAKERAKLQKHIGGEPRKEEA